MLKQRTKKQVERLDGGKNRETPKYGESRTVVDALDRQ